MSDIKIHGRGGSLSSVFGKPEAQLNYREHDDAEGRRFAQLIEDKNNRRKTQPSSQEKEPVAPLSGQGCFKVILGCLSRCFSKEKLEWRFLDGNQTKLAFPASAAAGINSGELRVRIENTRLGGCELVLCGTLKKLNAELVISSKEQLDLINSLKSSFMGYLQQALPGSKIDFSVRMAGAQ